MLPASVHCQWNLLGYTQEQERKRRIFTSWQADLPTGCLESGLFPHDSMPLPPSMKGCCSGSTHQHQILIESVYDFFCVLLALFKISQKKEMEEERSVCLVYTIQGVLTCIPLLHFTVVCLDKFSLKAIWVN